MPLQQHHIEEYKRIYKKQFGEDLSDAEAWEQATNLINLARLLLTHRLPESEPLTSNDGKEKSE
jgi:hypothetical protein